MSKISFLGFWFFLDILIFFFLCCAVTEMEHRSVKKAGIEVQETKGWSLMTLKPKLFVLNSSMALTSLKKMTRLKI